MENFIKTMRSKKIFLVFLYVPPDKNFLKLVLLTLSVKCEKQGWAAGLNVQYNLEKFLTIENFLEYGIMESKKII